MPPGGEVQVKIVFELGSFMSFKCGCKKIEDCYSEDSRSKFRHRSWTVPGW